MSEGWQQLHCSGIPIIHVAGLPAQDQEENRKFGGRNPQNSGRNQKSSGNQAQAR